jgi:hypothetical protein
MIYHIRKKYKVQRGNQFYKDRSDRNNGTFCGSEMTDHDIRYYEKIYEFNEWACCPECEKLRSENRNER